MTEISKGVVLQEKMVDDLERVRKIVLPSAEEIFDKPWKIRGALENVEAFGDFESDWNDPDVEGNPGHLAVFTCATIGLHSDEDGIPRYSTLLYLGPVTVGSQDVTHVVHCMTEYVPFEKLSKWERDGRVPADQMPDTVSVRLAPGDVILLDSHCPHWMSVEVDGKSMGDMLSAAPDPSKVSPVFEGINFKEILGVFVACSFNATMDPEDFATVIGTLRSKPAKFSTNMRMR